MKTRTAIAVRPYPNPLRARVFALLARAGVEIEVPPPLEGAVTNDDVVAQLRGRRADLLLVPYHALRDRQYERTSGLELVRRLRAELPELRDVPVVMPVVMPVSVFGHAAFEASWRRERPAAVLPIFEDALDEALLPALEEVLRR